jgi:hypothetical protein
MFSSCVVILWAFSCESYTDAFLIVQKHETGFLILFFFYITSKYGQINYYYLHLNRVFFKYCFTQDEILS